MLLEKYFQTKTSRKGSTSLPPSSTLARAISSASSRAIEATSTRACLGMTCRYPYSEQLATRLSTFTFHHCSLALVPPNAMPPCLSIVKVRKGGFPLQILCPLQLVCRHAFTIASLKIIPTLLQKLFLSIRLDFSYRQAFQEFSQPLKTLFFHKICYTINS